MAGNPVTGKKRKDKTTLWGNREQLKPDGF